jgi:hypothetical protein
MGNKNAPKREAKNPPKKKLRGDVNQAAFRVVREGTKNTLY